MQQRATLVTHVHVVEYADIAVGFSVQFPDAQGFQVGLFCLLEASLLAQEDSVLVIGIQVVAVYLQGLAKILLRFIDFSLLLVDQGQVQAGA